MPTVAYKTFSEYTSQSSGTYSAAAGDFVLVITVSYGQQQTSISGFTTGDKFTANPGDQRTSIEIFYKFEPAAVTNVSVQFANGNGGNYTAKYIMTFEGVNATTPLTVAGNAANNGATIFTGAISTSTNGVPMLFFGQMPNSGGAVPTFTGTPSGYTQLANTAGVGGWMRAQAWKYTAAADTQATRAAQSVTSNYSSYGVGVLLVVNQGNKPPVVTSQTPTSYEPIGSVTSPTTVSWTYSDAESNTQYKYEISYRVAGSIGAYTTVTSANGVSTTSHTFASNTFTDGVEYEWRLRLDDNGGEGWSPYYTAYFTAGNGRWIYGPQITGSSSTSITATRTFANYNFEGTTHSWANNNFFGAYTDCTFASTTTRPKSGSNSLEITWPNSMQSRIVTPQLSGFEVGRRYRVTADIYVPTGGPTVMLDPFLQSNSRGGVILDKDTWISAVAEFDAATTGIFFAVVGLSTTNGTKTFVDNVVIEALPPEPGLYTAQVRTSDAEGYGAWSTNSNNFYFRMPPTASAVTNTPSRVGNNITIGWTYSDTESQAQTKYQLRYRKRT